MLAGFQVTKKFSLRILLLGIFLLGTESSGQFASIGSWNRTSGPKGAVDTSSAAVNLNTLGTLDWRHFGFSNPSYKSIGPGLISEALNRSLGINYTGSITYTWTDGAPTASGSGTNIAYSYAYLNAGYTMILPAGNQERTFRFYGGLSDSTGVFTATLSDGSAVSYSNTMNAVGLIDRYYTYTVTYTAKSENAYLIVEFKSSDETAWGDVAFSAATLSTTGNSSSSGSISGSRTETSGPINLTTNGNADWVYFGDTYVQRKSGGNFQIQRVSCSGCRPYNINSYTGDTRLISWTGGAPTASGTNNTDGWYVEEGTNASLEFEIPAAPAERTVHLNLGGNNTAGMLEAYLTDGSNWTYTDAMSSAVAGAYNRNYQISFKSPKPGTFLRVRWLQIGDLGGGRMYANAASLQGPVGPTSANIQITYATYGNTVTCDAMAYAGGICNGETTCNLEPNNTNACGRDPQTGVVKFLKVIYTCPSGQKMQIINEWSSASLSC